MPPSKQRLSHLIKTEPAENFEMQATANSILGKRKYKETIYGAATARASKRARNIDESSDGETSPRNFRPHAGVKEKDRAKAFNIAFDRLRQSIPSLPKSKKLSKIEVLRLAICYLAYLQNVLNE
ncbi:helix-loop-helix protein 15-like [Rhopilema esculentum]|uniref:helix-loop-helix protein 15-like n=1 Tax=Rhopilema esculentum TaxID=499914 RepID=UPI0031DD353D|eukprot:gene728-10443_t